MADQSDTRRHYGGQLLIYDGDDLRGRRASAAELIARIDLGAATADLCRATTGRNPVRPHMILFNRAHTHAVIPFVASGHVVVFDGESKTPVACWRRPLAAPARAGARCVSVPGGSFILVASLNGKQLERIDANFATTPPPTTPDATPESGDVHDAVGSGSMLNRKKKNFFFFCRMNCCVCWPGA